MLAWRNFLTQTGEAGGVWVSGLPFGLVIPMERSFVCSFSGCPLTLPCARPSLEMNNKKW